MLHYSTTLLPTVRYSLDVSEVSLCTKNSPRTIVVVGDFAYSRLRINNQDSTDRCHTTQYQQLVRGQAVPEHCLGGAATSLGERDRQNRERKEKEQFPSIKGEY